MNMVKYDGRTETLNDKGELHSFNNMPAVRYSYGAKYWCKEGKLHRLDGPAVEYSGGKCWYYEGKLIKCSSTKEFLRIINLKAFW